MSHDRPLITGTDAPRGAVIVPIRLKTVYDSARPDPSGILTALLCLHVASWRAHVPSASGMTVTCIGEPSPKLANFLEAAGADVEVRPHPHHLVSRSRTYNKHLAAADDDSERAFLADNDTVYLTDLAPLTEIPRNCVAAALADLRRITPELWAQLQSDANVRVIPLDWIPWKERALAEREAREPVWERYAYFNGGAILFPPSGRFWKLWESETERLSAYLAARGLKDRKDAGSDQLSLTSAAARHGAWQLLPPGFNVRPFHFWIRDHPLNEVAQYHLIGAKTVLRSTPPEETGSLSAFLRRYWQTMLYTEAHPDKRPLAMSLLDRVLMLAADFDLDDVRGSATMS